MNFKREILSAIYKSGAGTSLKIVFNAFAIKIIALYMGPTGVGMFAQLRQLLQAQSILASLNSGPIITQAVASLPTSQKDRFISASFLVITAVNLVVYMLVVLLSAQVTKYLFSGSTDDVDTIVLAAVSAGFVNAYLIFFSSILNGYHSIGRYTIVLTIGGLTTALAVWPVVSINNQSSLELSFLLFISEVVALSACLFFLNKTANFKIFIPSFDDVSAFFSRFMGGALIMLLSGVMSMVSILLMRAMILDQFGFHDLGIFDSAWVICTVYTLVITKSFGAYFVPKLSSMDDHAKISSLIEQGFLFVLIVSMPIIIFMISFNSSIIMILYTDEFLAAREVVRWMLLGDLFKILSWYFGYTLLAFRHMRAYFVAEVCYFALFILGVYYSIFVLGDYKMIGVVYFAVSVIYFLITYLFANYNKYFIPRIPVIVGFVAAVLFVVIASHGAWNNAVISVSQLFYNALLCLTLILYLIAVHHKLQ